MKKFNIFLIAALAVGFSSCKDDGTNAIPQKNVQETVMSSNGVTVANTEDMASGAINLNNYADKGGLVPVLKITELKDFPAYYTVQGVMQLSAAADFANFVDVNLETGENNVLYAKTEDWESAHLQLFSKNPKARETHVRFILYGVNSDHTSSVVRLGDGTNTFFNGEKKVETVTPFPAAVVVEDSYSVTGTDNLVMTAATPEDVYVTPTFSAPVEVTEANVANFQWGIKSQSGKVYGVQPSADDPNVGILVEGSTQKGTISQVGPYLITINMEELTYKVNSAVNPWYLVVGGGTNGRQGRDLYTDGDYVNYKGYSYITTKGFRLVNEKTGRPSLVYSYDPANETLCLGTVENMTTIPVEADGVYWVTVNMSTLTYEATAAEKIGIVGDALTVEDPWNNDVFLTPSEDGKVWTGEVTFAGTGGFKFRANQAWDFSLGGEDINDLSAWGAPNIPSPEAGTYNVELDFGVYPAKATLTKK